MNRFLSKPVHLLGLASAVFMVITSTSLFSAGRLFSNRSFEDVKVFEKAAATAHFTRPQIDLLRSALLDASRNTDSYISSVAMTISLSLILVLIIPLFGRAFATETDRD